MDMGFFRFLFKWLSIIILIGAYGFWGYYTLNNNSAKKLEERKYIKCGTVKNKVNELSGDGDYVNTKLYLGVKYDDGSFNAEEMTPKTFLEKNPGDRICLVFYKELSNLEELSNILFGVSFFGLILFGLSKLFPTD